MSEIQERPWGQWRVVHDDGAQVIKVLTVNPGAMLSLQSHILRSEYWQPLSEGLVAYLGQSDRTPEPQAFYMLAGRIYRIERGVPHRLINPTAAAISVVEVINGTYSEDDIKRYHDAYGRV